ncbi:uncharacterized protein SOCE26_064980 [Sorangium cellulosum]|uniref:Protein kinase domain-containing protein n=1 Tax=Sorangium cellulosum TaxID=56 RepID=A0A2L0F0C4_SORCE|nr:serine/threonine-protein kinase [Sorangium cellulosum]AUX45017.1 uncharacterized protein SOCE26_064980 [Sorangium cellulosum]
MRQGEVIADRFVVEELVGAGGMGQVYRARDRLSGAAVAVKVLSERRASGKGEARFAREAEVLASIHHPGIVRYVAHGTTGAGVPYLAMEWLAGEDLGARLQRLPLTLDEAVALVSRAAGALAAVHDRGVVHRDVKPSNLFLVDRDVARVKLLDFGIALRPDVTRMTQTGALLGTAGYMAPEQARGAEQVDARADVFALGCVLFECLTGAPAFVGKDAIAVVAKIAFDEAPRLGELRPDLPAALDALCARMLAKQPDLRPRDGAAVLEELAEALAEPASSAEPRPGGAGARRAALTRGERRTLGVVLVGAPPAAERPTVEALGATLRRTQRRTMALSPEDDALRREAEAHGGRVERLPDGAVAITLAGAQIPTDQAAQAARCALAIRACYPDRPIALAMGRAASAGLRPWGDAIVRAAALLARHAPPGAPHRPPPQDTAAAPPAPIALDEMTAGLLDARFDVREGQLGLSLSGERAIADEAHTLLGKPTPCVGRD